MERGNHFSQTFYYMQDLSLEKFDPSVADLTALVESSKAVSITDFESKEQLGAVHQNRMALKNARVQVEKRGKELRADAITFQKAVIDKEKELVAIILPEEERLASLEEEAKGYALRQERLRKLPERNARLIDLGFQQNATSDEQFLAMDDLQFETFYNGCVAKKVAEEQARVRAEQELKQIELDKKQAEIEAKEREIKEKVAAEQRERERLAEIERARLEGEQRAKEEQARKEREEAARKVQEEADAKEAAAKLEKTKKYKAFLESYGWTEATREDFKIEQTATGYVLFKRLGEFLK